MHAAFLAEFFPLVPNPENELFNPSIFEAFSNYYPFVLLCLISEIKDLKETLSTQDDYLNASAKFKGNSLFAPYIKVVKNHILIIFLVPISTSGIATSNPILLYSLIYAVYFFPFKEIRKILRNRY